MVTNRGDGDALDFSGIGLVTAVYSSPTSSARIRMILSKRSSVSVLAPFATLSPNNDLHPYDTPRSTSQSPNRREKGDPNMVLRSQSRVWEPITDTHTVCLGYFTIRFLP